MLKKKTIIFLICLIILISFINPSNEYKVTNINNKKNYKNILAENSNNSEPYIYYNPPKNSFGSGYYTLNESYWDNNIHYTLFCGNNNYTNRLYINVTKLINSNKYEYSFKSVEKGYYYLNISFKTNCDNITIYDNMVLFDYDVCSLGFNWNDLIPYNCNIVTNIVNDVFSISISKSLNKNFEIKLDPTFGNSGTGDWYWAYLDGTEYLTGWHYTMGANDGVADNISFICDGAYWDKTIDMHGMIYEYLDADTDFCGELIGETDVVEVVAGSEGNTIVLPFSAPKPCLVANTEYYLVVSPAEDETGSAYNWYEAISGGSKIYKPSETSVPADDPLTGELTSANQQIYIICSYTEGSCGGWTNTCPVLSNPTITNNSNNIALDIGFFNFTITDLDGNTTSGTIECNNTDSDTWTNLGNGTRNLTLSTLTCGCTYTIWVNYSDENCNKKEWFTFNTINCGCVEWGNTNHGTPNPVNNSNNRALSFNWIIPITEDDGCNGFNYTIECNNSQTTNANGAINGSKTLSLSGLSYNTTYTVWVNSTNYDGANITRSWYNFTTMAQPTTTGNIIIINNYNNVGLLGGALIMSSLGIIGFILSIRKKEE